MQPFDPETERDEGVVTEKRPKTKKPRRWKVLLHNDDYTTMEFVVHVLVKFFHKSAAEAVQIMLQVHHEGVGVAGSFTREVAETKVAEATEEARVYGMPLQLSTEAE
jgi:ATP-dependent Clp protease adaptor protein ClpS